MERHHPIRSIRFLHKALRRRVEMIEELADEDLDLEEDIHDLLERVDIAARATKLHTSSEEAGLFPALEARVPNVAATYLFDHQEEDRLFDRLSAALHELLRVDGEGRAEPLARARRTAVALAEHVHLHIRKEHKHVLPLVEAHFSDDEQTEMTARMAESIPPEDRAWLIPWIVDVLDEDERREYQRRVDEALPAK